MKTGDKVLVKDNEDKYWQTGWTYLFTKGGLAYVTLCELSKLDKYKQLKISAFNQVKPIK